VRAKVQFDRELGAFAGDLGTTEEVIRHLFGPRPLAFALLAGKPGPAIRFALYYFRYSSFRGRSSNWLDDQLRCQHSVLLCCDQSSQRHGEDLPARGSPSITYCLTGCLFHGDWATRWGSTRSLLPSCRCVPCRASSADPQSATAGVLPPWSNLEPNRCGTGAHRHAASTQSLQSAPRCQRRVTPSVSVVVAAGSCNRSLLRRLLPNHSFARCRSRLP
jgi:hypothetical protein